MPSRRPLPATDRGPSSRVLRAPAREAAYHRAAVADTCRITLLGAFQVEVGGRPIPPEAWRHRRGADLVKLLALAPGHRLHRERIVEALWPSLEPRAGAANLRKALLHARRALGAPGAIASDGEALQLWPGGRLVVDAEAFEDAARGAVSGADAREAARVARRYPELLPDDVYATWVQGPRERLRRAYLEALRAAGVWERLAEEEPLDEEAHRQLMQRDLEAGDRTGAMRRFERLRELLHEHLGVGPDPRTVAVYQQVLADEGTEPSTPAERARAHLAAGLVALHRMDLREAQREARAARATAVDAGLGRELGEASGLLGMVAHAQHAWREVFRAEFVETVRGTPDLAGFVLDAHLCLAEFSLNGAERPDDVAVFARELLDLAEQHGSLQGRALASLILGEAALLGGDLDGAEANLTVSADLHERAGAASGRTLALARLGEAAVARGRRSRARRLLSEALALARTSTLPDHLVIRVHGGRVEAAPDPGRAVTVAREAEADLAGTQVCDPCSIGFRVASAVAAARAGDLAEARRRLEQVERVAGMWQGGPWVAAVWEARAELRAAQGDRPRAAAMFQEAADRFGEVGHRLAEARCRAAADTMAAPA